MALAFSNKFCKFRRTSTTLARPSTIAIVTYKLQVWFKNDTECYGTNRPQLATYRISGDHSISLKLFCPSHYFRLRSPLSQHTNKFEIAFQEGEPLFISILPINFANIAKTAQ